MRVHHLAMRTRDVTRLEDFYTRVLGLHVVKRDAARGSVWLDLDGGVLMIEQAREAEPPVAPGSCELVAFAVPNIEPWRERLAVEDETAHTLYFRDPDGRRIAVSDYPFR